MYIFASAPVVPYFSTELIYRTLVHPYTVQLLNIEQEATDIKPGEIGQRKTVEKVCVTGAETTQLLKYILLGGSGAINPSDIVGC